jgi:PAS domain S-box-containing protein
MKPFQDLPIQRKILVMTLTICGVVQLVAALLLLVFQIINFRANFQRDVATLSAIIANNSTAALAFDDRKAADEILGSLKARPTVVGACLVNAAGTIVAHYGQRPEADDFRAFPAEHQFLYRQGILLFTESVQMDGHHLGTLYLRANYQSVLNELLRFYGVLMSAVMLISVLLALLLTGRMQKLIADPVLNLAETSRQVGERNDYSVRSPLEGRGDELGVLAKAFNHMLSRIHSQDAALNLSQKKLESLVNSIDGIVWEWQPQDSTFTFISRQSERILGHPPKQWLGDPAFWRSLVHPDDLAGLSAVRVESTQRRQSYYHEYRMVAADGRIVWIRESGMVVEEEGNLVNIRGIFQDITERKNGEAQLSQLNRRLIDTSRQAGMAEMATGVLHNVGNVLNSVNVSANMLRDHLGRSRLVSLLKALELLREHSADTADFLTQDPRGTRLPGYLIKLGDHLQSEHHTCRDELDRLTANVEHIKEIVAAQQSYARLGGMIETFDARELVNDALRIHETSLVKDDISVLREYGEPALVAVDKHKVLQILVNLLGNARHALTDSGSEKKTITISIQPAGGDFVKIKLRDNGIGIPAANLTRIFQHGFTTKQNGHGFGLHSSANAAREMGGALHAHSDGPGEGALFTLELPAPAPDAAGAANRLIQTIQTSHNYQV